MKKNFFGDLSLLWAPWRKKYILHVSKKKGCVFCQMNRQKKDKKNFIIKKSQHSFAVLNLYPYNNGHVMIVPDRHVCRLQELSNEELLDLLRLQDKVIELLERRLKPHGFNVGMNLGRAGGAGVVGHIHIHVVPRWIGDTNFMPMIARTKVLSESLSSLHKRLTG